jgi:hypothetical protein
VVAAQQIRAHLANLDASAANAALTRGPAQLQAWKDYAAEQVDLGDFLISAAQNITYGDAERKPILAIITGIQKYADLIGRARALLEAADAKPSAIPDGALTLIADASALLNTELLPAAGRLNDANETALNETWAGCKNALGWETLGFIAAALPALALLVVLQGWIARRTHRFINPGLLAATLLMAVAALWGVFDLETSAAALISAKQDAFDSVRAVWNSRAIAMSANADESYFLLFPGSRQSYASAFQIKLMALADKEFLTKASRQRYLEQSVLPFQRRACIKDRPKDTPQDKPYAFGGLLGAELLNVTFSGECSAAGNAFKTLADYLDIDTRIRELEAAGQHDTAIALNVGVRPGESNFAFAQFDQALARIIEINQSAFENSIGQADARLAALPWIVAIGGALTLLLAFLGLRPRLNEYRVG